MIEEECAKEVSKLALNAISSLSQILNSIEGKCSAEEYFKIKKAIGLSIGKIQLDILDIVHSQYPELDDLG